MDNFYCFFCSSELDTDLYAGTSKCFNCEAKYNLDLLEDCVRVIKVNMCGMECACVKKSE